MTEQEMATAIVEVRTLVQAMAGELSKVVAGQERTAGQVADLRVLIEEKTGDLPTRHDVEALVATRLAIEVWRAEKEALSGQLAEVKARGERSLSLMLTIAGLELTIFGIAMAYLVNVFTHK